VRHSGKKKDAQVWALEHREQPSRVHISPSTAKMMRLGTCPGQAEIFIANNRGVQQADRVAQYNQMAATAIQKNTEVGVEVLDQVISNTQYNWPARAERDNARAEESGGAGTTAGT
jgi:hypothetical protein